MRRKRGAASSIVRNVASSMRLLTDVSGRSIATIVRSRFFEFSDMALGKYPKCGFEVTWIRQFANRACIRDDQVDAALSIPIDDEFSAVPVANYNYLPKVREIMKILKNTDTTQNGILHKVERCGEQRSVIEVSGYPHRDLVDIEKPRGQWKAKIHKRLFDARYINGIGAPCRRVFPETGVCSLELSRSFHDGIHADLPFVSS